MSSKEEERSLDVVQRAIISALVIVVCGSISATLALYISFPQADLSSGDVVGLWVMTGWIGIVTAVAVLVINRRRPYSPWVVLGLVPMAVSAFWVFGAR
ncbi:MAG TPA: hypothetical protein VF635_13360 [Propionibacteriaceae bacterium]